MTRKLWISYIFAIFVLMLLPSLHISGQTAQDELGLKTVVIDPGHGGKDPGAPGKTSKTSEKHIVLSVAKLFGDKIKAAYPDVNVVYTRSTDVFVELKERANIAKRNKADLFVSIHCNSIATPKPYGASVYILGPSSNRNPNNKSDYFEKSQSVAQRENSVMLLEDDYKTSYQDFNPDSPESVISNSLLWMANYENSLLFAAEYDAFIHKAPYRESKITGIHQDIFYLLWATNMPAALLEIGFISNPDDYAVMSTKDGQEKIAQSIFKAFCNYKTKFDASVGAVVSEPQVIMKPAVEAEPVTSVSEPSEESDIYYGIQIMGLGRLLKHGDPALKGLKVQAIKSPGSNIYKYVYGNHQTRSGANGELKTVRKKFPDAFVVKVSGNEVERIK